jgi:hypothetical protein
LTLTITDIAPLKPPAESDTATLPAQLKHRAMLQPVSRRGFLARMSAVGTAIGLFSLGIFPPARHAFADGYDIWTNPDTGPCGSTGYAGNHNCSPGCGGSTVCGGTSGGACCTADTVYHRNSGNYTLRPNQCWPVPTGTYDGWVWRCSASLKYRCHDGYNCYFHGCGKDICRKSTST